MNARTRKLARKRQWIERHRDEFDVASMCRVLGVGRSGLYAQRQRTARVPGPREIRRQRLAEQVRVVHEQSRGTYGAPRVAKALQQQGEAACRNTVAKLMRQQHLRGRGRRRRVPRTTDSRHAKAIAANVLDRNFDADRPDQSWVGDITYITTAAGFLYLAVVIDLFSRKIIGWSMTDHMRAELCTDALTMALSNRRPAVNEQTPLLFHSDRGSQYAGDAHRALLEEHGLTCSMSRVGDCWDNAVSESFFATLKTELVHRQNYPDHAAARQSIFEYMEVFYNRQRLHSSLDYLCPEAFEATLTSPNSPAPTERG